jgi:hypothetical protein
MSREAKKMRIRRLEVPASLIYLSILILSCSPSNSEWKGLIEIVDGVTIVENPIEPLYGEGVLELSEELSIGEAEGRDEYMFSRVTFVAVDDLDNIYVLDSKEAHIKVFNDDGEYLHTIGNKGQAPDEFQSPRDLTITPQNEILVNDRGARLLKYFDLKGIPLKQISHAKYWSFIKPHVDNSGEIVGGYGIIEEKGIITQHIVKFTADLDERFTVSAVELARNPEFNPYFAQQYWALNRKGHIIWGFPIKYELYEVSSEGTLIKSITKEYNPVHITKDEKDKWIQDFYGGEENIPSDVKVVWDEYRNAFQHISIDDQDRIFVQTYEIDDETGKYYYDVFDSEGQCIARLLLNSQPQAWKNNKLYTVEEDEDGYQYVKRYKVTWNF